MRALSNMLTGSYSRDLDAARVRYEAAKTTWEGACARSAAAQAENTRLLTEFEAASETYSLTRSRIEQELEAAMTEHRRAKVEFEARQDADRARLEDMLSRADEGAPEAMAEVVAACWQATRLPGGFPRGVEAIFDPATETLVVEIRAPNFEHLPLIERLKSGAPKVVSDRARNRAQEQAIYALPLRLLHELFSCPYLHGISLIGVNVVMAYTDKADGHRKEGVVATVVASRETVEAINIRDVEAKVCFRTLKGLAVPSIDSVQPVPPLLTFDRNDRRIVQAQDVLETLDSHSNLAAMDWEQFEHLVRELFQKMFAERSPNAEVNVTRASRDWGVDAIVFDPDPVHGGRFVIQAKRYTNRVDVSAVRDLYGVVLNEGASKGFLVTTSVFGPDSYEFAAGKPITLIDGRNLLSLFERFGYRFSIDLQAAKSLASA